MRDDEPRRDDTRPRGGCCSGAASPPGARGLFIGLFIGLGMLRMKWSLNIERFNIQTWPGPFVCHNVLINNRESTLITSYTFVFHSIFSSVQPTGNNMGFIPSVV